MCINRGYSFKKMCIESLLKGALSSLPTLLTLNSGINTNTSPRGRDRQLVIFEMPNLEFPSSCLYNIRPDGNIVQISSKYRLYI